MIRRLVEHSMDRSQRASAGLARGAAGLQWRVVEVEETRSHILTLAISWVLLSFF
jgi:hypothetical protein